MTPDERDIIKTSLDRGIYITHDLIRKLFDENALLTRALELTEEASHGEWCNQPEWEGSQVRTVHDCKTAPKQAVEFWTDKARKVDHDAADLFYWRRENRLCHDRMDVLECRAVETDHHS